MPDHRLEATGFYESDEGKLKQFWNFDVIIHQHIFGQTWKRFAILKQNKSNSNKNPRRKIADTLLPCALFIGVSWKINDIISMRILQHLSKQCCFCHFLMNSLPLYSIHFSSKYVFWPTDLPTSMLLNGSKF